jgi:hypothetical protein
MVDESAEATPRGVEQPSKSSEKGGFRRRSTMAQHWHAIYWTLSGTNGSRPKTETALWWHLPGAGGVRFMPHLKIHGRWSCEKRFKHLPDGLPARPKRGSIAFGG